MSTNAAVERMNYYGDPRVREAMRTRYYEVVAVIKDKAIVKLTDWAVELIEDDDPEEYPDWFKESPDHTFFAKALSDSCYQCEGKGTMVNPGIDAGGISSDDEFWEDDYDYETGESRYMRGDYDVACSCCGGSGLCQSIEFLDSRVQKWIREMEEDDYAYQQERLAELRYGC